MSDRSHSTADDIDKVVRAEIGTISRQAVYDALGILTAKGLLRASSPPVAGSPRGSGWRQPPPSHLPNLQPDGRRRLCGGLHPCLTAADDSAYEIDEAEVIYWGRCPECVAATSAASGG